MRIEAASGHLDLRVAGYQLPEARGDPFDDSWLVVVGDVRAGDLHWRFRDPCLLVAEATEIGRWLRRVADPGAEADRLGFVEPCLAFDVAGRDASHVTVRVELAHEAAPHRPGSDPDDAFALDLPVPADDLVAAAEGWLEEVGRFPAR